MQPLATNKGQIIGEYADCGPSGRSQDLFAELGTYNVAIPELRASP